MSSILNFFFRGVVLCFSLLSTASLAQGQPTDNPYRGRYGATMVGVHWTDNLKWQSLYDVTAYGAVANDGIDDIQSIELAIQAAASNGGGIVYFPAGIYLCSDTLMLKTGVILRGAGLRHPDARNAAFRPLSRIEFPAYQFDSTADGGRGNANASAFKYIGQEPNAHDFGVVDLDINRARLVFQPWQWQKVQVGASFTYQPIDTLYNVLVLGCRSNNTAIPSPNVPDAVHKSWQRFCWRFAANIDVFGVKNIILNNNRLNDSITDNFNQPNYILKPRGGVTCQVFPTDGSGTAFRYTDHYGISLNRCKLKRSGPSTDAAGTGSWSAYGIYGMLPLATPEKEPYLFATGNEVCDNWIFKTMRVGIWAAGLGLKVENNQTKDLTGKWQYVSPDGVSCLQPVGPTLENRGIDFSGWKVRVRNNDLEVYQHSYTAPGGNVYGSTDGEAILLQELGGGTAANDIEISGNTITASNGLLSLFKIGDINNLLVRNNRYIGSGMHQLEFSADRNGDPNHYLNNVLVDSNYNVGSVTMSGSKGGILSYLSNNIGTGTSSLRVPCHVVLTNNTLFGTPVINNPTCPTPTVAQAVLSVPARDTIIQQLVPTSLQLPVKVYQTQGDLSNSQVSLYLNSKIIASGMIDATDSSARFTVNLPSAFGDFLITARLTDGTTNLTVYSPSRLVRIVGLVDIPSSSATSRKNVVVYPNPTQGMIKLSGKEDKSLVELEDLHGRKYASTVDDNLDLGALPSGIYVVRITSETGVATHKIIKQ